MNDHRYDEDFLARAPQGRIGGVYAIADVLQELLEQYGERLAEGSMAPPSEEVVAA